MTKQTDLASRLSLKLSAPRPPHLMPYAGNKKRCIDSLLTKFPHEVLAKPSCVYVEPFVGTGAVWFSIKQMYPCLQGILNDTLWPLIDFYRHLRTSPRELAGLLISMMNPYLKADKETRKVLFYEFRDRVYNPILAKNERSINTSVVFNMLMRICFNGLYRTNANGYNNSTMGMGEKVLTRVNHQDVLSEFRLASRLLYETTLFTSDFRDFMGILDLDSDNSFVYFDPPYLSQTAGSHTRYSKFGFGMKDHRDLSTIMRDLALRGVKSACSNSDTDLTYQIYRGMRISPVHVFRSMSCIPKERKTTKEVLIMNW